MAQAIRDVMTTNPVALPSDASLRDAAHAMKTANIGDVLVIEDDAVLGLVTDRDIVVRAIAEGRDPTSAKLTEVCSPDLAYVGPDDAVDRAVTLMRERAVRRLPVVDDGLLVGMVSIGDLAREQDPTSALADISAAPPNQ